MTDRIVLTVGGGRWQGWTEISVTRSIEQLAGTFDLTLTDRVAVPDTDALRLDIQPGARCTVAVAGDDGAPEEVVITGHIDRVAPSYDARSHAVRVAGRDATGDLVDCSAVHAPSGEFTNATALAIAQALAQPFGIPVSTEADIGGPFATFRIQEGETVYEAINRACRCRALLAVSNGRGGLVLTRGRAGGQRGTIAAGGVLGAEASYDLTGRFSEITVKGQASLDDVFGAGEATAATAVVRDAGVGRHRPLIVIADDMAAGQTLASRGRWEADTREGQSRRATLTLLGWRDQAGRLWQPNTIVRVLDPWLGLRGDMLIASVTLGKSESEGTTSRLSLVGANAYDLLPTKDKTKEAPAW